MDKENALLRILVNNATAHANNLKNLSDFLQSLLRDPQKFAAKALKAAEAYDDVVKAIEEVLKIAQEANGNSRNALVRVCLFLKRVGRKLKNLSVSVVYTNVRWFTRINWVPKYQLSEKKRKTREFRA